jgi:hypothetical protein
MHILNTDPTINISTQIQAFDTILPVRRNTIRYKVIEASILAATLSALAMTQHAAAQTTQQPTKNSTRRTIFVPAMGGLERNIVSALDAEEVPIDVVMEQPNSDLQVKPTISNSLPPIEVVLYRKATGHDPFSLLDVVEVKTNRSFLLIASSGRMTRNIKSTKHENLPRH